MSQPLRAYDRLRAAEFSDEQARAILEALSGDLVTRDYLDARLQALEHRITDALTVRMLGIGGLIVALTAALSAALGKIL
jgi:hypothetical protein